MSGQVGRRILVTGWITAVKMLRFALLLALMVGVLAACSTGDDDDEPTNTPETTTEQTSTSEETTPATEDTSQTEPAQETSTETATDAPATEESTDETAPTDEATETQTESPEAEGSPTTPAGPSFGYGWNVALRGDDMAIEHNAMTGMYVNQSGFNWVRFQISWAEFERAPEQWDPLPYDRMIEAMTQSGLNVLLVIAKAPDWALSDDPETFLSDYDAFGNFVSFIADRYQGKVQAYEIWNEQNLAAEWGGHVNPAEYVEMLQVAHDAIKAVDPNAQVVFGGLTPTGITDPAVAIDDVQYLQQVYEISGGALSQYFDVLGMHLNSTHQGPDATMDNPTETDGWADDPSFFFRRGEDLRAVMVENGDEDKPAWITEFGWTTANQAPGYEYGANNTEQEVADFLVRSFEIARDEWGWVTAAFVWNLNWSTLTDPADEKYPWSALNADGSARPAYIALSEMPKP